MMLYIMFVQDVFRKCREIRRLLYLFVVFVVQYKTYFLFRQLWSQPIADLLPDSVYIHCRSNLKDARWSNFAKKKEHELKRQAVRHLLQRICLPQSRRT